MDEDTPDEITDNMIQADYLKEKHKEVFKEEVRQVCLKAKTQLENGSLSISKPKQDPASNPPVTLAESVSSTSLSQADPPRDEEVTNSRVDEINSNEAMSQLGSPRTDVGANISPEQQLESAITSPTAIIGSPDEQTDLPTSANHHVDSNFQATAANAQLLQRSPSDSSVASVGSIGSLANSNVIARGVVYNTKEADTILTNSLSNHFTSAVTPQPTQSQPDANNPESKTDKDTSGSEYNTLTSSRTDALSSTQDSVPSGEHQVTTSTASPTNPSNTVPVTPPVPIAQSDIVAKDKNKRLNAVELDKQLTLILSHAQNNVNGGEGQDPDSNVVPLVPVMIPLTVPGNHSNITSVPLNELSASVYRDNVQADSTTFVYPYPNASMNESVQVNANATDEANPIPPNNVVPVMIALSPSASSLPMPVPIQSLPGNQQIINENIDTSSINDASFFSDGESIPSHTEIPIQPAEEGLGAPEAVKKAAHPQHVPTSAEPAAVPEKPSIPSRFQVTKVQEDVIQDCTKVSEPTVNSQGNQEPVPPSMYPQPHLVSRGSLAESMEGQEVLQPYHLNPQPDGLYRRTRTFSNTSDRSLSSLPGKLMCFVYVLMCLSKKSLVANLNIDESSKLELVVLE